MNRDARHVVFDSKIEVFPVTETTRYDNVKWAFEHPNGPEHDRVLQARRLRKGRTGGNGSAELQNGGDGLELKKGGDGGSMADDLMDTALDHQHFLRLNAVALEMTAPCWQKQAADLSTALLVFLLFLFFVLFLILLVWLAVRTIEQSKTFRPRTCDKYYKVDGFFWTLPSGGLLLEYGCHHRPGSHRRPVLFLHGNTENLDVYAKAFRLLDEHGYRVFALEYAGYGTTQPGLVGNYLAPNASSLECDLMEAWDICGSSDAIVMGFSLGGGLLGVGYPYLCPAPAQLVFLNTFGSFPRLVEDNLQPCLAWLVRPFLTMRWRTRASDSFCGSVLIVRTRDDESVPCHHGKDLARRLACLDPKCVDLPSGGHVQAILCHQDLWVPYLLSSNLCE